MQKTPLSIAYSPCPNDTFIFFRLAQEADVETTLDDVESLNRMAFEGGFDVTKLSFHAWLLLQDRYELLNTGAALGRGCGPLVISKSGNSLNAESVVAVPGEYTTAHLLLQLWRPDIRNRVSMTFDKIMDAVDHGEVDAGVIIHEGRFVYRERGLNCIRDLGEWWEAETGNPIPLGCIAAKKSLGADRIVSIEQRLKASIEFAFAHPDATTDYVRAHAQELSDAVIRQHIKTYVNDFTLDLGEEGRAAIDKLQTMAKEAGIIR
jgi:1,4-dihydroxy-6-naphthoate synthase